MRATVHRSMIAVAAGIAASTLSWSAAEGDVIHLRGGGTLQGVVIDEEGKPGYAQVYTATASAPVSMRKDRIERVIPADSPLGEYVERRGTAADTPESQLELAQWCEEQKLRGPAGAHYERVVALDPENAAAHEKLGHVFWDGKWRTYTEVQQAQGLVLYKGKWQTPEGKQDLEERENQSATHQAWLRKVRALVRQFHEGNPTQRAEAERQLRAIEDPEAVIALVNVLGHESADLRVLLAQVIGPIDDPRATAGLVHRIVNEDADDVRQVTRTELVRRQDPTAVARLHRALDDANPRRVGRAAAALGAIGSAESVPKLIPKLVSRQRRVETVMVPATQGLGGGGIGVGFSRPQGTPVAGDVGAGFYSGPSIPVLTGPVVAPGVVAYGVTAVPFGAYTGLGTGANAPGAVQGAGMNVATMVPKQVVVPYLYQNVEVLAALELLTGENFGYNLETWKRWLRTEFQVAPRDERPARQVPQP